MPPPFATIFLTIALIAFFIAVRISTRDDEREFPGDFIRMVLLSLTTAASLRLAIIAIAN